MLQQTPRHCLNQSFQGRRLGLAHRLISLPGCKSHVASLNARGGQASARSSVRSEVSRRQVVEQVAPDSWQVTLKGWTEEKWYSWVLEGVIFMLAWSLQDAGFTGDWHRLGWLTLDQEATCRAFFWALLSFHLGCVAASVKPIREKNLNRYFYVKVLGVGFTALVEVLFKDPQPAGRKLTRLWFEAKQ
ncbi:hypothetical protein WJX73_008034 [Symbiochloris irregularis]|uniref:Uncharacterized protein n=1 Tax=Symbiochloris irregularis TaxID=706552 RepID=A0AAW1PRR1_9CHLO